MNNDDFMNQLISRKNVIKYFEELFFYPNHSFHKIKTNI